ncbi:hypothetical protein [Oscillibacter sp.]
MDTEKCSGILRVIEVGSLSAAALAEHRADFCIISRREWDF